MCNPAVVAMILLVAVATGACIGFLTAALFHDAA
jgi:hypothetical protein